MNKNISDYSEWMTLLKSNYRKGAGTLKGILANPALAAEVVASDAAVMAIYGDADYSDGSCWCAKLIGETEYAPDAFNHYLNLIGVSDKETWELTVADTSAMAKVKSDSSLVQDVLHSNYLYTDNVYLGLKYDSWDKFMSAVNGGNQTMYDIGETMDIELSGFGTMTIQIADFDHDYVSGATTASKHPVTFITKDLLYNTYQMNSSNTNVGGFNSTALQGTLNNTIYNALPSEVKSSIKTAYKWYGTGNSTTNGAWYGYKLWIPLEYEMHGTRYYSPETEQTTGNARQYPIFTDNASRIKKMNNGSGSANWYWNASPRASGATGFCIVSGSGSYGITTASNAGGVCFGFCV